MTPAALPAGSSLIPAPGLPKPMRERDSGFEGWRAAGVDSMVVVPLFQYVEPVGRGEWSPVTLQRADLLSRRYCSAYDIASGPGRASDGDIGAVGGCAP